jgi:hypothetical protein
VILIGGEALVDLVDQHGMLRPVAGDGPFNICRSQQLDLLPRVAVETRVGDACPVCVFNGDSRS